ncbi:hypothetical protein QAD02_004800 [Eretmocerus hayati]|uniref:Uncharacterized protein n=1 Tax=Eretmocerus hayati TaxID=131215 RepID=A0ACC2NQT7_9HYME|nr:hypothetical protein QAD02_004800 [Eretmocerus hayati]
MVISTTDFSTVTENEQTETTMSGYASSEMASTSAQPTTMTTTMVMEMRPKGRALNISASDLNNNLHSNATDLSDVSMDDEDKEIEGGEYIAAHNGSAANMTPVKPLPTVTSLSICIDGNKTYSIGEKIKRGCDEQCVCEAGGKITNCEPVCQKPLFKIDMKIKDPLCHVSRDFTENPCCGILVCADLATEPEESCVFGNTTVARGQKVEDGCSKTCICEAGGHLKCQPRCPPNDTTPGISQHDRCVVLKDPRDNCCTITLCDVTLGDHEVKAENPMDLSVNLTDVKVLNSTAIQLKLSSESFDDVTIEISENNHVWRQVKPTKDGVIADLQPAHGYYVRVLEGSRAGPSIHVSLLAEVIKQGVTDSGNGTDEDGVCIHRGKSHKIGEEWYDDCIALCQCNETAQIECITIECPTDFGLDVLDRNCIDWETVPPNHVPKAPNCCPQEVRCRSNGSCSYEGVVYDNWSEIPSNVTGCEKNCFCEFGKVSCSPACPPVSETPPAHLNCRGQEPILAHLPGDECCTHWICDVSSTTSGYEQGSSPDTQAPTVLGPDDSNQQVYEVVIEELRPINMNTVRLMFSVPSALVNLHGRVEVRYTSDKSNGDPSTWKSQIFTLPGDLIGTKELEFDLGGLKPWTSYKLMILVKLRDISIMPASKIYQVRTLDKPEPTEISVDPELRVVEVNSTVAELEWRKFTAYELQFIDGIYLTYKAHGDGQFSETPLLHKSVNSYVLENLRSSTTYEVHFSTKDVMGQTNILINSKTVNFTTDAETDPYSFDVEVEIKSIKPTEVEVLCSGVPHPQDKYVNIYRAVYQTDSGKEETSTFKITKKESQARTTLSDLKPATHYRLWIELYLTNGKIKKSIVKTFMTKSGSLPPAGASQQQGKFAASVPYHEGDYYGPLVVVAIVASLAILSTLILLMMLMKRRVSSKADISPRKTTSAYDNPSYKVELQQETMGNFMILFIL